MSYQALARKWRPKRFADLVGQDHVVRALTNALERGRLHHAYLLTGTRGVGKTTIARLLAKSLNCATGVTATPCGVCPACVDIDAGRFVDLLELDAASNTGIDNMREILDNARYAPTVGRYKVYLIDEVHMLSKAAFNSMLKTLEEPPEHVKFILATTDPQKIPVTVLSRCLQFNLKLLPAAQIASRLADIVRAEDIAFDDSALALIAHSAHGSMRDALSVLDQAIAYGAGEVREAVVRTMLGAVDAEYAYRIVDALLAGDGKALLAEAAALSERSLSLPTALDELASVFHRIAVAQTVAGVGDALPDAARIAGYATAFTPDAVQLAYQICVQGRADMALAPDEATGFAMTLLRLLAFEPGDAPSAGPKPTVRDAAPARLASSSGRAASDMPLPTPTAPATPRVAAAPVEPVAASAAPLQIADWPAFVAGLKLSGIALQLAAQTELKAIAGNEIVLAVPEAARHLIDKAYTDKLKAALDEALGRRVRLRFDVDAAAGATLAAQEKRERAEAKAKTEAAFRDDPFVQDVLSRFDATIKTESIKPSS
ncbi:MAG TPA: DNA polymerase III subunit gamma/tau [Casimicrobiaceae bacterium]|nr:DNA polymerase III subunit gamma/tau [Casimicrobiaceae bacterium]